MQPIKGTISPLTKRVVKEHRRLGLNEQSGKKRVVFEKEILRTKVKVYYLPEDEGYAELTYDPRRGDRLFDNEEQAQKAGFERANTVVEEKDLEEVVETVEEEPADDVEEVPDKEII